jgi:hypothetical protein
MSPSPRPGGPARPARSRQPAPAAPSRGRRPSTFCNVSSPDVTLTGLTSRTASLSSHASIVSRDRDGSPVPGGAGSEQDFLVGTLTPQPPQDCEDVTYEIGLNQRKRFSFYVDLFGFIQPNTVSVSTDSTLAPVCDDSGGIIATPTINANEYELGAAGPVRIMDISPIPTGYALGGGLPIGCGEAASLAAPQFSSPQSSITVTYECDCP